jgi:predicted glycogen debranching enzyme
MNRAAPTLPLVVPGEIASDLDAGTRREWLETNGLGSFAMGTVAGPATRRYHALLCAAERPPVGRLVLVNRCEETVLVDGVRHALGSNFYPGVVHPDGHRAIAEFRIDPWPTWRYRLSSLTVERTLFMPWGRQMTVVVWRLIDDDRAAPRHARLFVRPLISGRDYHALHRENAALRSEVAVEEGRVRMEPYYGVPPVYLHHNGVYAHRPDWYRRFEYPVERERGLEYEEDLFSPGELSYELAEDRDAIAVFSIEPEVPDVARLRESEAARRAALGGDHDDPLCARLAAAGDHFIVQRSTHRSVIAGYPWFTDWGRDAFISLPGLSLCRAGGAALGREVVLAFAPWVKGGLVPNRFPDGGDEPEYNSVDAPLWFVLAACRAARACPAAEAEELVRAIKQVVEGYLAGTRYNISVDDDGLIRADAPGMQLTWMDAKIGDWVVTPRAGKPVEIQALWVAALEAVARLVAPTDAAYAHELAERAAWARSSFASLFWHEAGGYLYDVVDGARRDETLRPNQLYALGLCAPLVEPARAERALAVVERELLTPFGLRTRARGPGYHGRIAGDQAARDAAYHEGTVWPFLLGIFADACVRVRGAIPDGLLDGITAHVAGEGMGAVHEIFDGDAPYAPRGCPAQAWSVAECLRVARGELGKDS